MNKISFKNASKRKIDNNLAIIDLFDGANFKFDFVVAELNGVHPTVINFVSDRVYYILEGTGEVVIDGHKEEGIAGDLFVIPKNTTHSISGNAKYIVITSPPFNPKNEQIL